MVHSKDEPESSSESKSNVFYSPRNSSSGCWAPHRSNYSDEKVLLKQFVDWTLLSLFKRLKTGRTVAGLQTMMLESSRSNRSANVAANLALNESKRAKWEVPRMPYRNAVVQPLWFAILLRKWHYQCLYNGIRFKKRAYKIGRLNAMFDHQILMIGFFNQFKKLPFGLSFLVRSFLKL